MDQKELSRLLRLLADLIERSPTSEVDALLSGHSRLQIVGGPGNERRHPSSRRLARESGELHDIIHRLQALESREEGMHLLQGANLTKKELEAAARLMDLPVIREDDSERLMQKMVEASIGARLNSRAIRG